MLQNIEIRNAPAFGVPSTLQIGELSGIDVIFGPNGSGKTTISRALANPSLFGGVNRTGFDGDSQLVSSISEVSLMVAS